MVDPRYRKPMRMNRPMRLREIKEQIFEMLTEKLCKKGKAYVAKRKAAGEKHGAYLMGRAVKVCKGQMKGEGLEEEMDELKIPHRKSGYMGYSEPVDENIVTIIKNALIELQNPKKADLNKDGKLSDYEKIRGKGIEKAMGLEETMSVSEVLNMEIIDENITEAKYKGKTVTLNKPMRGDSKKFKVYVNSGKKNADGSIKVKKVEFGAKGMNIKKNNPKRRKAFRARHRCDNPGPKTMARYWSCKKW